MEFNEKEEMKDVLLKLKNSDYVEIVLNSGKAYTGVILEVGIYNVRIKLAGPRSYYDAILKIEDITAVEFKVRG